MLYYIVGFEIMYGTILQLNHEQLYDVLSSVYLELDPLPLLPFVVTFPIRSTEKKLVCIVKHRNPFDFPALTSFAKCKYHIF